MTFAGASAAIVEKYGSSLSGSIWLLLFNLSDADPTKCKIFWIMFQPQGAANVDQAKYFVLTLENVRNKPFRSDIFTMQFFFDGLLLCFP